MLSDERLAEIEALLEGLPRTLERLIVALPELLTEVRRLRRALRLSEASRGVPSVVGAA